MTDPVRTFWTVGDLRCVLVNAPAPQHFLVQVLKGSEVLCSAFIDDPVDVEAPAAADRLRAIFRRVRPLALLALLLD